MSSIYSVCARATEEQWTETENLIAGADIELKKETTCLSKQKSGLLLKREQEKQGKLEPYNLLTKVRQFNYHSLVLT